MKIGDSGRVLQWRRLIEDMLIGGVTFAVAVAAIGTTADVLNMLLISGALVGIALMLEPGPSATRE